MKRLNLNLQRFPDMFLRKKGLSEPREIRVQHAQPSNLEGCHRSLPRQLSSCPASLPAPAPSRVPAGLSCFTPRTQNTAHLSRDTTPWGPCCAASGTVRSCSDLHTRQRERRFTITTPFSKCPLPDPCACLLRGFWALWRIILLAED